jgi:hypothetical protein
MDSYVQRTKPLSRSRLQSPLATTPPLRLSGFRQQAVATAVAAATSASTRRRTTALAPAPASPASSAPTNAGGAPPPSGRRPRDTGPGNALPLVRALKRQCTLSFSPALLFVFSRSLRIRPPRLSRPGFPSTSRAACRTWQPAATRRGAGHKSDVGRRPRFRPRRRDRRRALAPGS